jgi:hypothetical protein
MATASATDRMTIIAELRARVDRIEREARALSVRELSHRVAVIGIIARSVGLLPLTRLADSLAEALARDGRAACVRNWTDAMRESISHDVQDETTARLFLASVGVRLAS